VFAGDAAALLVMRIPKADQYGMLWSCLSPFLFMPFYSLIAAYFRIRHGESQKILAALPAIAVAAALWKTLLSNLINYSLGGPSQEISFQSVLNFCVGDYLGTMTIVLPCLLWIYRSSLLSKKWTIAAQSFYAALMICFLYASSFAVDAQGKLTQLVPLMAMLIPAAYLMVTQGWHGAAIGVLMVNGAMALALPRTNVAGVNDDIVLLAQSALVITSSVLLGVGAYITRLSNKSAGDLVEQLIQNRVSQHKFQDERRNVGFLKAAVLSTEQQLREKAILLASAGKGLTEFRDEVARALREQRQSERAMQVMAAGMQSVKLLERQSGNLYPFKIELPMGLYEVLAGPTFLDVWEPRAKVYQRLRGSTPRALSVPLRLSVYRSVERAFEALAVYAPSEYDMSVQVWRRRGRCGVIVDVRCTPTRDAEDAGDAMADCLQELELRALMYDGTLKRRGPHRLSFLMSEPEGEVQAWASPGDAQAAGPTADA